MKLQRLRQLLAEKEVEALLITNPYNRRYMTGFTGSAGIAIVSQDDAVFITDFRYTEQAAEQVKDFRIVQHTKTIFEEAGAQLKEMNIQTLGFEKDNLTYGLMELYDSQTDAKLVPVSGLVEQLRIIKTDEELVILQQAADIADKTYEYICTKIRAGVTELEIANEMEFYMRKLGATQSSFDTIVASGVRGALPHGVASNKVIEEGDMITLDFGALYNGYISDMTRTVAVGEPSEQMKEIYQIVLDSQLLGVEKIGPNMTGKEADAIVRDYITEKGYGEQFGHSTGHGIGLEVHENPSLSFRSDTVLVPNMCVTVEPGIYVPNVGGVRIEDDLVITEDGNRRLTKSSKELRML